MKKIYLLSFFVLAVIGCEKEENIEVTQNQDFTTQIQEQFSLSKYEDQYVRDNLKVNWRKVSEKELKDDFIEFTTDIKSILQNENSNLYFKYTVKASFEDDNRWNFNIVKFTSYENVDLESVNLKNLEKFTGTIHQYNFAGILISIEGLEKGKIVSTFKGNPASLQNPNSKYYPADWDDPADSGRWKTIKTQYFRDYWSVGYNSSGTLNRAEYLGSYMYDQKTEYIYEPVDLPPPIRGDYVGNDRYHQHQNAPHGPAVNQNPHSYEEDMSGEPVQIKNELEGKADCVYKKMVDGNNNINWILENFNDGDKPSEFDLILRMSTTLSDNTNAITVKSGKAFYMKINSNRIPDRTALSIARTIIHEGIHARLREFASRNGSNAISFPGVYDYFRIYKKNWDHQQMSDHYRKTIAEGLQQYDNNQKSPEYYMDLAWEGLSGIVDANNLQGNTTIYTEAWKKLTNSEQQRVLNNITNEKQNGTKVCE